MAHEAWELLRVFHPAEQILFDVDGVLISHERSASGPERQTACPAITDANGEAVETARSGKESGTDACGHWIDGAVHYEVVVEPLGHRGFRAHVRIHRNASLLLEETIGCTDLEAAGSAAFLVANRKIRIGSVLVRGAAAVCGSVTDWGALTGVRPVKLVHMGRDGGMVDSDILALLIRCTGMTEVKARLLLSVADAQRPFMSSAPDHADLYIGIPFCVSRCLYCSFPSYSSVGKKQMIVPYLEALSQDMVYGAEMMKRVGLTAEACYVGGGTPTALSDAEFERMLHRLVETFDLANGTEFTVEAGRPDTITAAKLRVMRACGVNRISVNPQTMNDATLRLIGRGHTSDDVRNAYEMVRDFGFETVNMDLIAGLPDETEVMFDRTLEEIRPMAPDNLTIHTMAVKRASRLHEERMLGTRGQTDDATVARMVASGAHMASSMGLQPYYLYRQKNIAANLENIGYARPGTECGYNIHTMEENRSVLAFGSGAISKRVSASSEPDVPRIQRAENVRELNHYIGRIDEMAARRNALWERPLDSLPRLRDNESGR